MQAFFDFVLKLHAVGLSHEAVIEIMIALLGVMIAVLTLISALVSIVFGFLAFWGFQTMRQDAKRMAARTAARTAKEIATQAAKTRIQEFLENVQAAGLIESEAEDLGDPKSKTRTRKPSERTRATTDKALTKGGPNDASGA